MAAEFLSKFSVYDLVKDKRALVDVLDTTTIRDAARIMNDCRILSVPVYAPKGKWTGGLVGAASGGTTEYIGIISMFDIVSYIVDSGVDRIDLTMERPVHDLLQHYCTPQPQRTGSECSLMTVLPSNVSLWNAFVIFGKRGVHHCVVRMDPMLELGSVDVGDESPKYRMLTQTDLIRFLYEHGPTNPALSSILMQTVEEVGAARTSIYRRGGSKLGGLPKLYVSASTKLQRALKDMSRSAVSAIAVVADPEEMEGDTETTKSVKEHPHRIIGTLSASDFRSISLVRGMLANFVKVTVAEFIRSVHPAADGSDKLPAPVVANGLSTLYQVMSLALAAKVHRVWLVDREFRVDGVVTFTDVISVVYDMVSATMEAAESARSMDETTRTVPPVQFS